MRSIHVILVSFALAVPLSSAAQSEAVTTGSVGADSQDTITPSPKKKKGGLLGKAKGLAKNKVVKTIAKTAACTMLPGGQIVASAIDGGAEGAAGGAVAGVATGQTGCMPGGGMLGNPAAAAGEAAAAETAGAAGLGAGLPGVGLPGMPTVPGHSFSPEQMKQMQEHYKKMGIDPAQLQAMQEMMANMPAGMGGMGAMDGEPVEEDVAPYSLRKEKGRLVLRRLPWAPAAAVIQKGRQSEFNQAISQLAAEILSTTRKYKIEVKVEVQGAKAKSQLLAKRRAAAVIGALTSQGVPLARLTSAGGSADNDPRVVLSESKPAR